MTMSKTDSDLQLYSVSVHADRCESFAVLRDLIKMVLIIAEQSKCKPKL
uniref:Uncharacterized protein n=1 Tax=Anguilla anguilla TaxID=7936 RepID=A0A0E9PTB9_ANGAN